MSDPIAMILRFTGEPDSLAERFEKARQLWIAAQGVDYIPPDFYAACKTKDGLAIITTWPSADAHRGFGREMRRHLEAVGMSRPEGHERLRIDKLGWH